MCARGSVSCPCAYMAWAWLSGGPVTLDNHVCFELWLQSQGQKHAGLRRVCLCVHVPVAAGLRFPPMGEVDFTEAPPAAP